MSCSEPGWVGVVSLAADRGRPNALCPNCDSRGAACQSPSESGETDPEPEAVGRIGGELPGELHREVEWRKKRREVAQREAELLIGSVGDSDQAVARQGLVIDETGTELATLDAQRIGEAPEQRNPGPGEES